MPETTSVNRPPVGRPGAPMATSSRVSPSTSPSQATDPSASEWGPLATRSRSARPRAGRWPGLRRHDPHRPVWLHRLPQHRLPGRRSLGLVRFDGRGPARQRLRRRGPCHLLGRAWRGSALPRGGDGHAGHHRLVVHLPVGRRRRGPMRRRRHVRPVSCPEGGLHLERGGRSPRMRRDRQVHRRLFGPKRRS